MTLTCTQVQSLPPLAAYGDPISALEYLLPLFGDRRFEMDEMVLTCLSLCSLRGGCPSGEVPRGPVWV